MKVKTGFTARLEAKQVEIDSLRKDGDDSTPPSSNLPARDVKPLASGTHHKVPSATTTKAGTPDIVAGRIVSDVPHPFVDGIQKLSHANAERLHDENLKLLPGKPDPAAALAALEDKIGSQMSILVRRSAKDFAGILRDMRMKSAYEEPGKRDAKYLEYREETERDLGFYDYRPAYGYVAVDELTRGAATEYGDIIMTLKGVEQRSSFCMFDSFDQGTRDNFEQNCYTWDDVAQLIINQQLQGVFKDMPFAYDEAQIMNGIVATDIGAVDIPNGAEYEALVRQTREALPWVGIKRYDRKAA